MPIDGPSKGAIVYANGEVIVADTPQIAAFNATTGAQIWSDETDSAALGTSIDPFNASPALDSSSAPTTVYAANIGGKMYAVKFTSGAPIAGWPVNIISGRKVRQW